MNEEFAVFLKVNHEKKLTPKIISKKMEALTCFLNTQYKGKMKFTLVDIRKKPDS